MNPLLAIDTSGPATFCSVRDHSGKIFSETSYRSKEGTPNSESVSELAWQCLRSAALNWSDIRALIYGSGPGSFTGLRLGLSYLKGISVAQKIPILAIPSLCAYGYEFRDKSSHVVVFSDAQREEFFCAVYGASSFNEILKPQILTVAEIDLFLRDHLSSAADTTITKCGFCDYKGESLSEPKHVTRSLIELSDLQGVGNYSLMELVELEPLYLRKVNARTIEQRGAVAGIIAEKVKKRGEKSNKV